MSKLKVLLVYNKVWPYRVKVFELLNEWVDLTVGFSDPSFMHNDYSFKTTYLPVKGIGPFEFHRNLKSVFSEYDVLVFLFNIRSISLISYSLGLFRRKPVVLWGIGVRASYQNSFDSRNFWDNVRYLLAKRTDATVFYSSYPIQKYQQAGVEVEKLFVANNTTEVEVSHPIDYQKKSHFIFVGTLYPQKGLEILLDAYLMLFRVYPDCPRLEIIGDGPEAPILKTFIKENALTEKVVLHGAIFDGGKLAQIFETAIACVSPNQAGLSVLTSMGNGTIFVTRKNAITGGEIFNIQDGINGILYDGYANELYSKLLWIFENKDQVLSMCEAAYDFYWKFRTPAQMAKSLLDSILFAKKRSKF